MGKVKESVKPCVYCNPSAYAHYYGCDDQCPELKEWRDATKAQATDRPTGS
jgi:hypothetical protein